MAKQINSDWKGLQGHSLDFNSEHQTILAKKKIISHLMKFVEEILS